MISTRKRYVIRSQSLSRDLHSKVMSTDNHPKRGHLMLAFINYFLRCLSSVLKWVLSAYFPQSSL